MSNPMPASAADHHLKLLIGDLVVQIAILRARIEELEAAARPPEGTP